MGEPFRLSLGTALKCRQHHYHRCLILSDPLTNGGYIVLVRITTDGRWRDRECVLTPSDWVELDRTSTVAFSTAMCGRVQAELLKAIQAGEFEVIPSPSAELLRKVIASGQTAEGMPPKAQRFLADI